MITFNDVMNRRQPDFEQLLKVLKREKPGRPVLFEIYLDHHLVEKVHNRKIDTKDAVERLKLMISAAKTLGYDYATMTASEFSFSAPRDKHGNETLSMNEGDFITDRESYDAYKWQDPTKVYSGRIDALTPFLTDGMKFIVIGPCGVLENVLALTGFDNLCYMLLDDPELAEELFAQVGERLIKYYKQIIDYDSVGAIISNDDWGFKTQTMLAPDDMRRYVFRYHKAIAKVAHDAGKPVILHSCGNLTDVMDDVIDDIGFDAKHSYEDSIQPIEEAYDKYGKRIAIMGGMDVDFLCRSTPEEIFKRSRAMLEKTGGVGYALGSGNSIPHYVPHDNYAALIAAAVLE